MNYKVGILDVLKLYNTKRYNEKIKNINSRR